MATLFGRGKSSHDIKYTELPQHLSEDEDELCDAEDDLLFVRSSSNGSAASAKRNGRYRQGEVIELGNLSGSPVKAARYHSGVEVRQVAFARKCFFIGAILSVGVLVVVLAIGLPTWTEIKSGPVENATWTTLFDGYGSESSVVLVDVDGDGILDVLLGMGSTSDLSLATSHDPEQFCKDTGRTFPCLGLVVALKGTTGQELWRTHTDSAVFLMNCEQIDVDQDGQMDCIMTGRQGTIVAINPRNGEHLWRAERTLLKRQWNIYQVSALPDADGDGVPEILVPHGGEPRFGPEEKNRHAGRLIVMSGKTGKTIGYLSMPKSKETYMTPVIYTWDDGSQYILFGSGGETIPGDFMAISVKDLYRHVLKSDNLPDTVKGKANQWDHMGKDNTGIITIFNNTTRYGIMVPPVLVDVNRDGVKDILMLAFEGKMVLFEGKTLKPMWSLELPGFQAYSTPAPGFFDVDEHPDFMVVWNQGVWPNYSYAQTIVVSGADGAVLWKTLSQEFNMESALSLATKHLGQDVFLFELVGREGKKLSDVNGAIHGIVPQRNLSRRSAEGESMEDFSKIYNSWKLKHSRKSGDRAATRPGPSESAPAESAPLTSAPPDTAGTSPPDTLAYSEGEQASEASQSQSHEEAGHSSENGEAQGEGDKAGSPGDHITCDSDLSSLRGEVFLMDRTTLTSPILLFTRQPEIYNYTLTDADRKLLLHSLNKDSDQPPLTKLPENAMKNTLGEFCTVLKTSVLNTGAVGDVDGDGRLDYVLVNGLIGLIHDRKGSYIRMVGKVSIEKLNLVSSVEKFQTVSLQTSGELQHTGSSGKHFQFLGYTEQSWTAYLGKHGNGVYTPSSYRPQ